MPKTALLLTIDGVVRGHFHSYADIAYALGVTIDDKGCIRFIGEKVNPSYSLQDDEFTMVLNRNWTKESAIADWAEYHMQGNLPRPHKIYRYIT